MNIEVELSEGGYLVITEEVRMETTKIEVFCNTNTSFIHFKSDGFEVQGNLKLSLCLIMAELDKSELPLVILNGLKEYFTETFNISHKACNEELYNGEFTERIKSA